MGQEQFSWLAVNLKNHKKKISSKNLCKIPHNTQIRAQKKTLIVQKNPANWFKYLNYHVHTSENGLISIHPVENRVSIEEVQMTKKRLDPYDIGVNHSFVSVHTKLSCPSSPGKGLPAHPPCLKWSHESPSFETYAPMTSLNLWRISSATEATWSTHLVLRTDPIYVIQVNCPLECMVSQEGQWHLHYLSKNSGS